jgi:hypothetical protein
MFLFKVYTKQNKIFYLWEEISDELIYAEEDELDQTLFLWRFCYLSENSFCTLFIKSFLFVSQRVE